MDFKTISPEEAGVSSVYVQKYVQYLKRKGIATHSMIMLRKDSIFYENYWAPFTQDFKHRMYSITKSMTAIAVGFAIQDGLMSLDDTVAGYFDEELTKNASKYAKQQTVRDALMMASGVKGGDNMFAEYDNFVKMYFDGSGLDEKYQKVPGTMFLYDTRGVTVLGAAVETVTGKPLMEYLKEKLFDKIGVSGVSCLQVPGGYSWAESGMICTPRDLLKIALFVMRHGSWDGEQILDADYLKAATSNLISSDTSGNVCPQMYGYGYLIWQQQQNSFCFIGMGGQFAICIPEKEVVFIHNGDGQGNELAYSTIVDTFYDVIIDNMQDEPLERDEKAYGELCSFSAEQKLYHCVGETSNDFSKKINKKVYTLRKNPMGMEWLSLEFGEDSGVLKYKNAQGEKELKFGMGHNVFSKFPQEGYSDMIVPHFAPGNYYDCAVSAEWQKTNKLHIAVQVIDKYFGRLDIFISFRDETQFTMNMVKTAENFFNEYCGWTIGYSE